METKLSRVYYGPKNFWKGLPAFKKLAKEGVSEDVAKLWPMKRTIWQIYLPALKHIPRTTFDVESSNAVHQADLLFLPHDRLPKGKRVYEKGWKSSTTYLRPVGVKKRDSTLQVMWDIPLPLVSWNVVKCEPQIQCSLWRSSISRGNL